MRDAKIRKGLSLSSDIKSLVLFLLENSSYLIFFLESFNPYPCNFISSFFIYRALFNSLTIMMNIFAFFWLMIEKMGR